MGHTVMKVVVVFVAFSCATSTIQQYAFEAHISASVAFFSDYQL
jgi:hypothetical protein